MYVNHYYCDHRFFYYITRKYYDELAALDPMTRSVRRFERMLEEIPIHFEDEDIFCGHFGCPRDFFSDYNDLPEFPDADRLPDSIIRKEDFLLKEYKTTVSFDRGHITMDYATILTKGLRYYESIIESALIDNPGHTMWGAMRASIKAVRNFMMRIQSEASRAAEYAQGPRKARLERIADMAKRLPYEPARDFVEAIQSVWLIYFLEPLSSNAWYSISLGNFDQYMLPYYQAAENAGAKREIHDTLYEFYCLLNSYADNACALNVGPLYNDFSRYIIECQKEFSMPGPVLAAKISGQTEMNDMELLVDEKLFTRGQPSFYFSDNCKKALRERKIDSGKSDSFAVESCMAFGIEGDELNSMWGCVLQMNTVLEKIIAEAVDSPDGSVSDEKALWERWENKLSELLPVCSEVYRAKAEEQERNAPAVFASAITETSARKGMDRVSGVTYHNVTVECMGLVNAADGTTAICELVFKQKKYTLRQIYEAEQTDFQDNEDMWVDIMSCPKYGCGNTAADDNVSRLMNIAQRVIRNQDTGNYCFLPSMHTLDANVGNGRISPHGFDGRKNGEPLAKNIGPNNFVRQKDPASMILSAGRLPQTSFFGGQPLDIHFAAADVRNHPREIAHLIQTYGMMNGLSLQVNSVSAETLRKAIENPEEYNDLVVRIGGYSCFFTSMDRNSQIEFVERFEREELR